MFVCMRVCACVYDMCVCVYACMHVCVGMRVRVYVHFSSKSVLHVI